MFRVPGQEDVFAYEFLDVPAGQYNVTARMWGYEAASATVDVVGNAATVADFALIPL